VKTNHLLCALLVAVTAQSALAQDITQTSPQPTAATSASAPAAPGIASKIEFQGKPDYVQVTDLVSRERAGMLSIRFEVSNSDRSARSMFWRVKWLDEAGFQVWEDEAWKPVLIQGAAKQNLQTTSPTTKARDFRIQFTAADNTSFINR
jgi:hypothetical protein